MITEQQFSQLQHDMQITISSCERQYKLGLNCLLTSHLWASLRNNESMKEMLVIIETMKEVHQSPLETLTKSKVINYLGQCFITQCDNFTSIISEFITT